MLISVLPVKVLATGKILTFVLRRKGRLFVCTVLVRIDRLNVHIRKLFKAINVLTILSQM